MKPCILASSYHAGTAIMLSYQHIYHAGNAADVQKHLWLIRVLTALKKNERKTVLARHPCRAWAV